MRGSLTLLCALGAGLLSLSGCGNDRPPVVSTAPSPSARTGVFRSPRAGLQVALPANLRVTPDDRGPGVFRATLGEPFVSCFAYPRSEQLPRDARELEQARVRLTRTVRGREAGYRLQSSRVTQVAGADAVELLGKQPLARRQVTVRSLHVFKGQAEYVIEVVAPSRGFSAFDRRVSPEVKRTLRVTGRVRRP